MSVGGDRRKRENREAEELCKLLGWGGRELSLSRVSGSLAVGMTGPDDLSALPMPSPYSALWPGNLVIIVGGKANNVLLVLLKENKRKTV